MHRSFRLRVSFLICPLTILLLAPAAGTDTTVPGGNVWGTWDLEGSPYWVTGDITLPQGETLIVEPGVEVYLQGHDFDAYGYLEAVGTPADSILFQGGDCFRVGYSAVPSQLDYCCIIDGNQLRVGYTDPEFSNCRLENDVMSLWIMGAHPVLNDCMLNGSGTGVDMYSGAAITMNGCTVENHSTSGIYNRAGDSISVTDCQFMGNAGEQGGGIRADLGTVSVSGCTFIDNLATNGPGGAINSTNASLTASECTFIGNICYSNIELCGGAIGLYDSDAEIDHSTFHGNNLALGGSSEGSAIGLYSSNATVDHCDFGCQDSIQIATVMVEFSNLSLSNSIFYDVNSWFGVFVAGSSSSMTLGYCNFFGSILEDYVYGENAPGGVGDLVGVNVNGDSCDVYGNIFLDPLFTDPWNCDYTLQEGSPCIDAGDPGFPYDPDNTITDIGRHYYNQESLFGESAAALPPAGLTVLCRPNPCRSGPLEVSFLQTGAGEGLVTAWLYDISGRLVAGPSAPADPIMGRVLLDTSGLCPGVYLCRVRAGERTETASVVVMR
jgi:hypothetical protein